jgi:HSP20 family protein
MSKEKKTEATAAKQGQNIQRAAPASMFSPFEEMEHWFGGAFPARWRRRFRGGWPSWDELPAVFEGRMPSVDVIDRDDEILVRAETPGVDKKDLDVSVTEDSVCIKGSVQHEEEEEKGEYYRRETTSGLFTRTVGLPSEVDTTKVKAKFKDSVLEMTLPKLKQSKRQKVSLD